MTDRREALAALEHAQWLDWVAGVIDDLPPERQRQMRRFFMPYEDLPKAVKDINRNYADRVLETLEER